MKAVTVLSLLAAVAQAHPTQERAAEKAVRAPHPGAAHQLDKAGGFSRSAAERQKPKRAPQGWGYGGGYGGGGYGGWWGNPGGEQSGAPTGAPTGFAPTGVAPTGAGPTGAPTATSPGRVAAASSSSTASTTCKFLISQLPVALGRQCADLL